MNMMKAALAAAVLLAFSTPALADSLAAAGANSGSASQAGAAAGASSDVNAKQNNSQQSAAQSSVNINNTAPPNKNNTPDVFAPQINNTAPCIIAMSGGFSVAGVGASLGTGREDDDCKIRQNAVTLADLGHKDAALAYLCDHYADMKTALEEVGESCTPPHHAEATPPTPPSPQAALTPPPAKPEVVAAAAPAPAPAAATPVPAPLPKPVQVAVVQPVPAESKPIVAVQAPSAKPVQVAAVLPSTAPTPMPVTMTTSPDSPKPAILQAAVSRQPAATMATDADNTAWFNPADFANEYRCRIGAEPRSIGYAKKTEMCRTHFSASNRMPELRSAQLK